MDPITHGLISVALDRAGLRRVSRNALAILVVAGVAPDLDLLSYFGGARAYFHYHYALLHSIAGAAILAFVIALIFWLVGRRNARAPLRFRRVLLLCAIGVAVHILLDGAGTDGAQLFWPFRMHWFSWDILPGVDLWLLTILLAGLLVPGLFHLVSEEIGARKKRQGPSRAAMAALVLGALYIGARAELHSTAVQLLLTHDYHGATPMVAGAFPDSASPLFWRGVVDTPNTIENVTVPLIGDEFDANSSRTHFKPARSPALDAARNAPLAKQFLRYARFPLANLDKLSDGYRVTLRDLRFPDDASTPDDLVAVINLDSHLAVRGQSIQFAADAAKHTP